MGKRTIYLVLKTQRTECPQPFRKEPDAPRRPEHPEHLEYPKRAHVNKQSTCVSFKQITKKKKKKKLFFAITNGSDLFS